MIFFLSILADPGAGANPGKSVIDIPIRLAGKDADFPAQPGPHKFVHAQNLTAHSTCHIRACGVRQVFFDITNIRRSDMSVKIGTGREILPDARFDPCEQDTRWVKLSGKVFELFFGGEDRTANFCVEYHIAVNDREKAVL